jgi:hypothetical protein
MTAKVSLSFSTSLNLLANQSTLAAIGRSYFVLLLQGDGLYPEVNMYPFHCMAMEQTKLPSPK